ncbi:phasin family protein [Owenweeksia hongkongensis]|uniref:phasin family protein n=1 Tax=Owenweeksia hongkongensis TaxID=253245 RepID=UPI003A8D3E5D
MEDTFKKMLYSGIGFLSLTKSKIDEVVDDLIDRGRLSREEGEKIVNDFKKESGSSKEAVENELLQWMEKALSKMDIARKKDLEQLQKQVEELQKRVTVLESKNSGSEALIK